MQDLWINTKKCTPNRSIDNMFFVKNTSNVLSRSTIFKYNQLIYVQMKSNLFYKANDKTCVNYPIIK